MRHDILYKEDWAQARERFIAWWNGELIDRPVIQVTAPRSGIGHVQEELYDSWGFARDPFHPETTIENFERWCTQVYFGGEAYPNLTVNLGPPTTVAFLGGGNLRFVESARTVWIERLAKWTDPKQLEFDPNNQWWRIAKKITSLASEACKGKFFVGFVGLGGPTDILNLQMGPKELILDMFKYPSRIEALSSRILELWHFYYDMLQTIVEENMEGSSNFLGIWSPKRAYPLQCDFSVMISPKMFDEFVLPFLRGQCRFLDHRVYHMDGPEQIPHLDLLLSIEEIHGIQWVPGAGNPQVDSDEWFPLYEKIQKKGKLLVLLGVSKENLNHLIRELNPKGLLIQTSCNSEEEAKTLLREAEKMI